MGGMFMTSFLACCPLEMAVRNIAAYYVLIGVFGLLFSHTNLKDDMQIFPTTFQFYYPEQCGWGIDYLEGLNILLMITAVLAFIGTFANHVALVFPLMVTSFLQPMTRLLGVAVGTFYLVARRVYFTPALVCAFNGLLFLWEFYICLAVFSYFEYMREFYT